jgi:hypothetical protein
LTRLLANGHVDVRIVNVADFERVELQMWGMRIRSVASQGSAMSAHLRETTIQGRKLLNRLLSLGLFRAGSSSRIVQRSRLDGLCQSHTILENASELLYVSQVDKVDELK